MQTEKLSFKYRGKLFEADVAVPSDLKEALMLLGETYVYQAFRVGYLEREKVTLRSGGKTRKKYLKIKLEELTEEQKTGLVSLGIVL